MKTDHPVLFTLIAGLSNLFIASAALAYDEGGELHVDGTADEAEENEEEEVVEAGEEEYCGGGDDASPLDSADMLLGDGDWRGLYHEAGTLLREGRADWQRAQALSYLATAQLHMGDRDWAAARNFRLAFAVDAEQVSPGLRAELAIAQLKSGQRAEAHATASAFVQEECAAPAQWLVPSCWAAHSVMAEASDDVAERDAEQAAARAILPRTDDLLAQVADLEGLIGKSLRVASR